MINKHKAFLFSIALLIVLFSAPNSFATSITLTSNGLGLSEGIYGSSLAVSDNLTLYARTRIGQDGYTDDYGDGIYGNVYVATGDDGIGVKAEDGGGSKEISGEKKHADEALVFQYMTEVDPNSIVLGLNFIEFLADDVTLIIDLFSGSDLTVPESSIETNFNWTGANIGYLNFSDLTEISGIDSITAFTVRAWDGHFYVNSIDYATVPEPATLLLFGIGISGLALFRRRAV